MTFHRPARALHHRLVAAVLAVSGAASMAAPTAKAAGMPLSAAYAADLEAQFGAAAQADPPLRDLMAEAIAKSGKPTFKEFLTVVRWCALDKGQAARVSDSRQENIAYLTRELTEPADADEAALRERYSVRAKESLPNAASIDALRWTFDPDIVVVKSVESRREICLQSGRPAADVVEYLAHEMIHYARAVDLSANPDALAFADARAYADKTVVARGDEVDAYEFEYALRVRRHGKGGLEARPFTQNYFTDRGDYLGTRAEFGRFIVEDLGYLKSRFAPQYVALLEGDLRVAEQKRQLQADLLKAREAQARHYQAYARGRIGLIDRLWAKYRADSENGRALLRVAETSRARLSQSVPALDLRIERLKAQLKAAAAATVAAGPAAPAR